MSIRVVLITGGNGGLGLAMARGFLDESPDNRVWLGVRRNSERARQLAETDPARCRVLTLEVTEPGSWEDAVEEIMAADQQLEVLVNNAGTHDDALLANMTPKSWREVLSASLDGAFHGCQAVLPAMISRRFGRIVNISSLSALLAPPGQTNYAAAKAGLVALTKSLAKEVARIGITVNAVCPGYIDTGAFDKLGAGERKAMTARVPMRRFGRSEEVVAAVRFLAGAEASYITGSILKVDGGIL